MEAHGMNKGYITNAGTLHVERIDGVKRTNSAVDLSAPPKGILHTTEGGWDSSLDVFRSRLTTPTFMIGLDDRVKSRAPGVRIAQLVPLGEMAAALINERGGVETNRVCRVQIEIVGFSKHTLWLPPKPLSTALAVLMYEMKEQAGIPYHHAVAHRSMAVWPKVSGWLGHEDVPENDHWDPGNLNWPVLFALWAAQEEDPYWLWLRWNLGEGEFEQWGARNMPHRPTVLPVKVPQSYWMRAKVFLAAREKGGHN
jgi:hypothetical protein